MKRFEIDSWMHSKNQLALKNTLKPGNNYL